MASGYKDLLAYIVGSVGDLPSGQVEATFRMAFSSFMRNAKVWRQVFHFDMAAGWPDPGTRASLNLAWQAAQAAASADPDNLVLAEAAAVAFAEYTQSPKFILTKPIYQAGTPPTYYDCLAGEVMRGLLWDHVITDFCAIIPPCASGEFQKLEIQKPACHQGNGPLKIQVYWVPTFDSLTSEAAPSWVYERYGDTLVKATIANLWKIGKGRKGNANLGMMLSQEVRREELKAKAEADRNDPQRMCR